MKKLSMVLLSILMVIGLAGCQNNNTPAPETSEDSAYISDVSVSDIKLSDTKNLVEASAYVLQSMDYTTTALAEDHEYNANFIDGLLENDCYGNLKDSVATGLPTVSEDGLTVTFTIKPGIKWVTNTGEEYADVVADDFVTGLRHGAEFASGTAWLLDGVIEGYTEYRTGDDYSDEAWETVGVKAVDDSTLVFTLTAPTPYFSSMTTYSVLYPINRQFLESKGSGCALGSPDKTACDFGTTAADSILYNGGFILETFDLQSSIVMKKNEAYWDAENVHIDSITRIYDDGSDPYSVIRGFESGTYAASGLSASWENYAEYMTKYDGYVTTSLPNSSVFGVVFNFNRQTFDETNYASDTALAENTHNALLNENFRKALRAAFDVKSYLMTSVQEDLAVDMMRNINNDPNIVNTSVGSYGDLVNKVYNEETGENVNLGDGQAPFYSPEAALQYIEAAKAEGIEFPVHLDMLVAETSKRLVDQGQSMKQSVETNTNGQIIIELVMRPVETVQNIAYHNMDPALSDYDISTFTGWSPDYADPKSFVDIYSPTSGYYMTSLGLTTTDEDKDIKDQVGLTEYETLYRTADAITDDLEARYVAFAKADAQLVETCFYIPCYMQSRAKRVSHVVPFTKQWSSTGIGENKYKGLELQESIVTTEQYDAAYAAWMAGKAN